MSNLYPFCKCGCNKRVVKLGNRFINGHNARTPKHLAIYKTHEYLIKVTGKNNSNWGKHCANRIKREIRECKCRCGKTFECKVNSKQRFIHGHYICGKNNPMRLLKNRLKITGKNNPMRNPVNQTKHLEAVRNSANRAKHTGENSSQWQGGISFEPYSSEFNGKLKYSIRKRDNNTCQLCKKTEKNNGRKLDVHHIDYNKKNSVPSNLISLCHDCNSVVNSDRNFWMIFFQRKTKNINIKSGKAS